MQHDIIIAGWGGQGVLLLGRLLARGSLTLGKQVTYFPSYGTEVRGGTANCHVKIADGEIYSPLVEHPTVLVVMNQPSYDRFRAALASEGWLLANGTMARLAPADVRRERSLAIPATEVASSLGNLVVANMVMLGALNEVLGLLPEKTIERCLAEELGGGKAGLLPVNLQALAAGAEAVRQRAAAS
jgi:2-oxoglutarate ferredoxin oxidoreductase subunit gamma